jgi:hypothetical protein
VSVWDGNMAALQEPTPAEREDLIGYARRQLADSLDRFLETGVPPGHLEHGGGTFGPLRDARSAEYRRRGIALYRPSEKERESTARWHDYCGEHGYPSGDLVGADTAPGSQYPPHPTDSDGGVWVGWSWARVRRELLGEHEPQQMEMVLA